MKRKRPPRSRQPRKAPPQPRGLRVRLRGTRTPDELRLMLLEAVARLDALGIRSMSGVNLYLTPVNREGVPVTPVVDGQPVTAITIAEPYRSAADEHGL